MIHRIAAGSNIANWVQFSLTVRTRGNEHLLRRLDEFPDAILVTGCQRSGTTMLSKILIESEGMVNYWMGRYRTELYGALILAGEVPYEPRGRYCFQTTYVYQSPLDYFPRSAARKLVWMLRNPFSVIRSMLTNWDVHFALDELFDACGVLLLTGEERALYDRYGPSCFSRIQRACLSYNGKVLQLFDLVENFDPERLMVVDYDDLVENRRRILPAIYDFVSLVCRPHGEDWIHAKSLNKKQTLSLEDREWIASLCMPVYERARDVVLSL